MEFGKIDRSLLDTVDFSLPANPDLNHLVLPGKRAANPVIHIGATRWTAAEWLGNLYPARARAADFLKYYSQQFTTIELNATHYKLYAAADMQKWAAQIAQESFRFCPKLYQGITHRGGLKGKEAMTLEFVEGMMGLEPYLGPVFLQLSDGFGPGRQVELLEYLSTLPSQVKWFVELRHPDWFNKPSITEHFFQALHTLKIGAVITDTAGRRDVCHTYLPVPATMIRFVANEGHPTDKRRFDAWVERIAQWIDQGLEEAYFFLHMGDDHYVPEFAIYAAEQFSARTGIAVKPPVLFPKENEQGSLF